LSTTLFDACARPLAKNVQGTSAVKANSGYGTPSDGTFARCPKKRLNTTIVLSGWMTAQATPSAVCLYRTFTSRQVRKYSSSRCAHSSPSPREPHPRGGSITTTGTSASPAGGGATWAGCAAASSAEGRSERALTRVISSPGRDGANVFSACSRARGELLQPAQHRALEKDPPVRPGVVRRLVHDGDPAVARAAQVGDERVRRRCEPVLRRQHEHRKLGEP